MRKNVIQLCLIFFASVTYAQNRKDTTQLPQSEKAKFVFVDKTAEFEDGGMFGFLDYIDSNKKYPKEAKKKKLKGEVFIEFVINKDGSMDSSSVKAMEEHSIPANIPRKDILTSIEYVQEAIRLVRQSPRWIPASYNGIPVKSRMVIPIKF